MCSVGNLITDIASAAASQYSLLFSSIFRKVVKGAQLPQQHAKAVHVYRLAHQAVADKLNRHVGHLQDVVMLHKGQKRCTSGEACNLFQTIKLR